MIWSSENILRSCFSLMQEMVLGSDSLKRADFFYINGQTMADSITEIKPKMSPF